MSCGIFMHIWSLWPLWPGVLALMDTPCFKTMKTVLPTCFWWVVSVEEPSANWNQQTKKSGSKQPPVFQDIVPFGKTTNFGGSSSFFSKMGRFRYLFWLMAKHQCMFVGERPSRVLLQVCQHPHSSNRLDPVKQHGAAHSWATIEKQSCLHDTFKTGLFVIYHALISQAKESHSYSLAVPSSPRCGTTWCAPMSVDFAWFRIFSSGGGPVTAFADFCRRVPAWNSWPLCFAWFPSSSGSGT